MKKEDTKNDAFIISDLFTKAGTGRRKIWERNARNCTDFANGEQLSGDEFKELEDAGMPTFTINRITPIVEMMIYFATANRPRWQAYGLTPDDAKIAEIHQIIADNRWIESGGNSVFARTIKDSIITGLGYLAIRIDGNQDRGKGELIFEYRDNFNIRVDPLSTDPLFKDASYIIYRASLPKSEIIRMMPDKKEIILKASGQNNRHGIISGRDIGSSYITYPEETFEAYKGDGTEDEIIDYFESYRKEPKDFMLVYIRKEPTGQELNEIKQYVDLQIQMEVKELEVVLAEKKNEFDELIKEKKMIRERALLEMEKIKSQGMEQIKNDRDELLRNEIMKATVIKEESMEVPEFKKLSESEEFLKIVQSSSKYSENRIKYTISIGTDTVIHSVYLPITEYPVIPFTFNHTGTPYPYGFVNNLIGKQREINKSHQILIHSASVGSNLKFMYEDGSIDTKYWGKRGSAPSALLPFRTGFPAPTPVLPAPLNNAFFDIIQYGEHEMEYLSGMYSSMQGDVSSQHETFKGLLANDEYNTRRAKAWIMNSVEPALEQLGKVFKEWSQKFYTTQKIFRIVQPDKNEIAEINIPIYNDFSDVINKFNDYESGKFDVKLVAGSTLPINRWARLQELYRWLEGGVIDDIAFLQETDLPDKEDIIKRKSMVAQLQNKLASMDEEIKSLNGTIETLKREVVQSEIKSKILVMDKEISKGQSSVNEKLQNSLAEAKAEIQIAKNKEIQRNSGGNMDKNK